MILYLCRHGVAEELGPGQRDEARALTEEGVRKMRKAAKGFAALKPEVTQVLTSPLVRARETAEIVLEVLTKGGKAPKLSGTPTLAPPGRLEALLSSLREMPEAEGVVAVGHEPYLGAWVGRLCFGAEGNCELKKGGMAAIELDEELREGKLLWLLTSGQLRGLAE